MWCKASNNLHLFKDILHSLSLPLEGLAQGLPVGRNYHLQPGLVILLKGSHVLLALGSMRLQQPTHVRQESKDAACGLQKSFCSMCCQAT